MLTKYLLKSLLIVFLLHTGNLYAGLIDSGFRAEYVCRCKPVPEVSGHGGPRYG